LPPSEALVDEQANPANQRHKWKKRGQDKQDIDLARLIEAITRERCENALVVGFVVEPELATIPRAGNRPPPFAWGGEQELPEPRTAPDQPRDLVVVIGHVDEPP